MKLPCSISVYKKPLFPYSHTVTKPLHTPNMPPPLLPQWDGERTDRDRHLEKPAPPGSSTGGEAVDASAPLWTGGRRIGGIGAN